MACLKVRNWTDRMCLKIATGLITILHHGCISIDRPFKTDSLQYTVCCQALKTYTFISIVNQCDFSVCLRFSKKRSPTSIYWMQQEFFCPFLIFNRDLGRYFSRKVNCFAFMAPRLFLEKQRRGQFAFVNAQRQDRKLFTLG